MPKKNHNVVGMFCGAGGLDLGFENAGFRTAEVTDAWSTCIETIRQNRPAWNAHVTNALDYSCSVDRPDVLLAGFPCQGFSLGGKREDNDPRNRLVNEVFRVIHESKPRCVVLENVLNLRNMVVPESGMPVADYIREQLRTLGYEVHDGVFKMSHFGVPQTRRRYIFVAFREKAPDGYQLPSPSSRDTPALPFLADLLKDSGSAAHNHSPDWGFKSSVHTATGLPFDHSEIPVPIRISRTGSDGNPIRSLEDPFPAIDTATVWGWARGNVNAVRETKNRTDGKYIRNPKATVKLWRISASEMRTMTPREYARLQTFPDDWVFTGSNKRDYQMQIGNAVPVKFAETLGRSVSLALSCLENGSAFPVDPDQQPLLFR